MEISEEIETAFWLGTFLMLFLTFGLIVLAVTYQRHYFKMRKNEAENMLKARIETEENERKRIAADLHDGVQGDLGAVKNYLDTLKRTQKDIANTQMLDEVIQSISGILQNTRNISYNLMPPLLQAEGIVAAVRDYCKGIFGKTNIDFEILCEKALNIEPSVSYHLFRIIQELTTNMIKYGKVSSVKITFTYTNNIITIHIIDNGILFNFTSALSQSKGSGLRNIASRLQVIGAVITHNYSNNINTYSITLKG